MSRARKMNRMLGVAGRWAAIVAAVVLGVAAGKVAAQERAAGSAADTEPAGPREVAGGPTVVLGRGVFGTGAVSVADLTYLIRATVGQTYVYSPLTNGPDPGSRRLCSGWWCVEFSNLVDAPVAGLPREISFGAPYPNPATGSMQMGFALPRAARVDAELVDVTGRRVQSLANDTFEPGEHTLGWDGRDGGGNRVHPGVYFLRVYVDDREIAKRRVVVVR